eukprot:Hpha_TRINITY_DN17599_c0_g1::TRINITY_DN17599_c0_g1_i1::g.92572::m.92572
MAGTSGKANFVTGVAVGAVGFMLLGSLSSQDSAHSGSAPTAPRASSVRADSSSSVPGWLQQARELYGSYARLAEASYGPRVWIVPEDRRSTVAAAKHALIERFRSKQVARDTVGDFETLWHFGLMAPQNGVLIEVGTCTGGGAMTIATAAKAAGNGARVISADLYERGWLVRMGYCSSTEKWKALAQEFGVAENAEPRGFCSAEVAHSLADGSVDGVFVDAEHHFEEVYNDISRWWPKLKPDGLMIGHDGFTHLRNSIALAEAAAQSDSGKGNLKLLETVATFDTTFQARGAASSGSGYGNCPQGAHVSLAAIRFAAEEMRMDFACCMPNSSIWHYRRLHTPDPPRLSRAGRSLGFIPTEPPPPPPQRQRPAMDGPVPICPIDPMQKKKFKKGR